MTLTLLSAIRFHGWDYRMTDKKQTDKTTIYTSVNSCVLGGFILVPDNCIEWQWFINVNFHCIQNSLICFVFLASPLFTHTYMHIHSQTQISINRILETSRDATNISISIKILCFWICIRNEVWLRINEKIQFKRESKQ